MGKLYFSKKKFIADAGTRGYDQCKEWVDKIDGKEAYWFDDGYYCDGHYISAQWIEEIADDLDISEDGRKIELPFSLNDVAIADGEPNVLEDLHLCVSYTVNGEMRSMPLGIWCSMLKDGTMKMIDGGGSHVH